jgi:hypothetical protein
MSSSDDVRRRRLGQRLACEILTAAEAHPERYVVLITGTREGVGCSTMAGAVARELVGMSERAVHLIPASELELRGPQELDGIVLLDGPALRDERGGLLRVPHIWLNATQAALVVVLARRTPLGELDELKDWLEGRRIALLGAVWNEHASASVGDRLRRLLGRFFGLSARVGAASEEVKDHG